MAAAARLTAVKNRTTVARTRMAPMSRRSRVAVPRASIMAGSLPKPHLLADFGHRRLGERAGPLGTVVEDPRDAGWVGHQLGVALAGLRVVADDPFREEPLRVHAAGARGPLAVPDL